MTPQQVRGACGLLGLTQKDLSEATSITRASLRKYDIGEIAFTQKSLDKLEKFFTSNAIIFLDNHGVMFKPSEEIRKLEGHFGFVAFMDDVYKVAQEQGGDICVSNVDERNWVKWMTAPLYEKHSKRMTLLNNFTLKILVEEKDSLFIANDFAEYRHIPSEFFNDQSFYVYGNKLALIAFGDDVRIHIINNKNWAESFRKLFNCTWNNAPTAKSK